MDSPESALTLFEELEQSEDGDERRAMLDEELADRYGFGLDEFRELDELLRSYAADLEAVHDEYRSKLEDRGFAEVVADGRATAGDEPTGLGEPVSSGGSDPLAALRRLDDLRADGVVSDDEFEAKKADLLDRV